MVKKPRLVITRRGVKNVSRRKATLVRMEVVRFLVLLSCQVVLCLLTIFGLVVLQTKTKKIVAEAQKDGYLLNFLQLELEEGVFLIGRRSILSANWSQPRHKISS